MLAVFIDAVNGVMYNRGKEKSAGVWESYGA